VELGFPSMGDPLIPLGGGCLITKHLKLEKFVLDENFFVGV
jgi:hypothetical protein